MLQQSLETGQDGVFFDNPTIHPQGCYCPHCMKKFAAMLEQRGVIAKGEKILDVVPDQDSLVVEAQIGVDDISDVHPNARAEVHLTAYKQRIVPIIHGDVMQISADRLTDPKTGNPYYTALVRVDEKELAALPNIQLYPGMPAQVMIPTTERTAFQYIVGPLVMSFNQAFRQK